MARISQTSDQKWQSEQILRVTLLGGLAGDAKAYHRFLNDLSAHVRAYLRRKLPQRPEDVEDLVQEVLLAVHNQRHTYQPEQPLTAWVHAIARYKLFDFFRARLPREALQDPLEESEDLLASSDHHAMEAKRDVTLLMNDLPDRFRLPIQHVKLEGHSVEEAAQMTGMSVSAIKVGIHRGLKALAKKMKETP